MSEGTYRKLDLGDPAPNFQQRSTSNPAYRFDTVGGRYIVLCFFGTAADEPGSSALAVVTRSHRSLFDDDRFSFFGVSFDPEDERTGRVKESLPGIRHFWDFDGTIARLYGVLPVGSEPRPSAHRKWVVLNPALQVIGQIPFMQDGSDRSILVRFLSQLPALSHYAGVEMHAPVIILPLVFEADLCNELIATYQRSQPEVSGFMTERDGKTVGTYDSNFKRRNDVTIEDQDLLTKIQRRVQRKVAPAIQRAHSFDPTRMERYIVGCYSAKDGGQFKPHRDNTTKATAHRRFALSVSLNDDFDGGELVFPEYGPRKYKVPIGSAIVFAGALLHQVTPVTRGSRFVFLPFLYDEAAAKLRERNSQFLAEGGGLYKAQQSVKPDPP